MLTLEAKMHKRLRKSVAVLAVVATCALGAAQTPNPDSDCACQGGWSPSGAGISLAQYEVPWVSYPNYGCEHEEIFEPPNYEYDKEHHCRESGGSCSTLSWTPAYQNVPGLDVLFDLSGPDSLAVDAVTVGKCQAASIAIVMQEYARTESFTCADPGKTLTRRWFLKEAAGYEVRYQSICSCPGSEVEEPPPGGGGPTARRADASYALWDVDLMQRSHLKEIGR